MRGGWWLGFCEGVGWEWEWDGMGWDGMGWEGNGDGKGVAEFEW